VSLTKSYRKDNEWQNTSSLGAEDLDKAIQVLELAKEFLNQEVQQEIVM
jgi:hypothetical protein